MNRGVKGGIIGTVAVALVTLGGLGAYNIVHGLSGDPATASDDSSGSAAAVAPAPQSTAPPSGPAALKAAQAFLDAWQAGPSRYPAAAQLTDAASNAQTDLTGYRSGLKLSSIAFSGVAAGGPSAPDPGATTVNFTVTAHVAGGTWTYPDTLNLVQSGGQVSVDWSSAMLYPKLLAGQSLLAGPVSAASAPAATVTARDGTVLTGTAYPSLAGIIKTLGQGGGASGSGSSTPNGVEIVDSSGNPVSVVTTFGGGAGGPKVVTTIDAKLQRVAENAVVNSVLGGLPAAVVVLDSSDGHILATAYGNSSEGDLALESSGPPGSTMKIITSAALFDMAGLYPSYPAPCNKTQTADSQTFSNESDIPDDPNTTIEQAFAESCNTAFIKDGFDKLVQPNGDASDLSTEAHDVFGLGQWNIGGGLQVATPQVEAQPQGSNAAADLIGQGTVTMSPLDMASVSATVEDGAFHQPVILPGLSPAGAAQPFNQNTAAELRQMMEFDASNSMGTAEPRLHDLPGSGGKTGTAQTGDGSTTNGWFTAFDHGIAVAAMVEGGANGVDTAGYIVQQVLESGE